MPPPRALTLVFHPEPPAHEVPERGEQTLVRERAEHRGSTGDVVVEALEQLGPQRFSHLHPGSSSLPVEPASAALRV